MANSPFGDVLHMQKIIYMDIHDILYMIILIFTWRFERLCCVSLPCNDVQPALKISIQCPGWEHWSCVNEKCSYIIIITDIKNAVAFIITILISLNSLLNCLLCFCHFKLKWNLSLEVILLNNASFGVRMTIFKSFLWN